MCGEEKKKKKKRWESAFPVTQGGDCRCDYLRGQVNREHPGGRPSSPAPLIILCHQVTGISGQQLGRQLPNRFRVRLSAAPGNTRGCPTPCPGLHTHPLSQRMALGLGEGAGCFLKLLFQQHVLLVQVTHKDCCVGVLEDVRREERGCDCLSS